MHSKGNAFACVFVSSSRSTLYCPRCCTSFCGGGAAGTFLFGSLSAQVESLPEGVRSSPLSR